MVTVDLQIFNRKKLFKVVHLFGYSWILCLIIRSNCSLKDPRRCSLNCTVRPFNCLLYRWYLLSLGSARPLTFTLHLSDTICFRRRHQAYTTPLNGSMLLRFPVKLSRNQTNPFSSDQLESRVHPSSFQRHMKQPVYTLTAQSKSFLF